MPFTPKDWRDSPGDLTTPITAVALEDLETRTTAYAEAVLPHISFREFSNVSWDGTPNVTSAINAALVQIEAANGGILVLPDGWAVLSAPIVLQNLTGIEGAGMGATGLYLANGSNCHMVTNYVSPDGIVANAERCSVRHLTLNGNKSNQTTGHGIYFNTNPLFAVATNDEDFDPHQCVEDVEIVGVKGNGFTQDGRSQTHLTNVYVQYSGGHGFLPSFDSFLNHCSAGQNGLAGFFLTAPNISVANSVAWYSGQTTAASGHGFHITYGSALIANCEAQDNKGAGFFFESTARGSVLSSCQADSNSTGSAGTYPGFDLFASSNNRLAACQAYERRANGSISNQTHALRIRSGSIGNDIGLHHFGVDSAVIADAIDATSNSVAGNRISINNEEGTQSPTFSATLTPNPYLGGTILQTLTGNVTIAAPLAANCHIGTRLTFVLTQDATGSRTGTWNAAFRRAGGALTLTTGVNKTDVISFIYNGTNWVETARSMNT